MNVQKAPEKYIYLRRHTQFVRHDNVCFCIYTEVSVLYVRYELNLS